MKKRVTLTYHKIGPLIVKEYGKASHEDGIDQVVTKIREQLLEVLRDGDIDDGSVTITIEGGK